MNENLVYLKQAERDMLAQAYEAYEAYVAKHGTPPTIDPTATADKPITNHKHMQRRVPWQTGDVR